MFTYQIYGILIQSNVPLPVGNEDLEERNGIEGTLLFEVELLKPLLPPPIMEGDYAIISHDKRHVYLNRLIGRYIISFDGSYVRYHPFEECDPKVAGGYFVGVVLPYILQMRGFIPLHGSSVVAGDKVWGFLGGTHIGKSTLQTEFIKQGYTFFSDDVISLKAKERNILAFPGYPAVKLEQVSRNNLPDNMVVRINLLPVGATKSVYSLSPNVVQKTPLPLGGLVILDPRSPEVDENIECKVLKKTESVMSLLANTFTLSLTNTAIQKNYIDAFGTKEFMDIQIWKVKYSRNFEKLNELFLKLSNLLRS